MTIEITQARVSVGSAQLAYLRAGQPGVEAILLLHGIPASPELFRDVMPLLAAEGFAVYAPSLPGYGQTRLAPGADYSLSAAADLLLQWIDQEGLAPIWLVGHDLGGAVAQFMAVRAPQSIAYLSMGDTVAGDSFPVAPVQLLIWLARAGVYPALAGAGLLPNPLVRRMLRRTFADPSKLSAEAEARIFWDGKVQDPQGREEFAKHLRALRNAESIALIPELRYLPMPVLLLWAREDRYQPWETSGRMLHDFLPAGTTMEIVNGAGHFLPLENPKAYVRRLLNWRHKLDTP